MKSLSKEQLNTRSELMERLNNAKNGLANAIARANDLIERAQGEVNTHLKAYNEILQDAREFRDEIAQQIEHYFEEKGEKWQDGERGQAYVAWKDSFEDADLDDIDIELPEEIESEEPNHADILDEWDEQPE